MKNKIKVGILAILPAVGVFAAAVTHAAGELFVVPTSVVTSSLAYVTGQLTDPGTQLLIAAIVGLGLIFYVIGRVTGLFGRRSR